MFGSSGVREGRPAREAGANLTVITQGRIFGTLGDSRCTVDALTQTRVGRSRLYRVEARGFCTQPPARGTRRRLGAREYLRIRRPRELRNSERWRGPDASRGELACWAAGQCGRILVAGGVARTRTRRGAGLRVRHRAHLSARHSAFTEGLFYLNGYLYESTGLEQHSSIRKVRLETGEIVQKRDVPPQYFGEGIVNWKHHLISLTWRSHVGFVYDLQLEPQRQFTYDGEGWALTQDGVHILMSDGTPQIRP